MCVPHFKCLNHITDFHEMNYELYVTGAYTKTVPVHVLQSAITTWRTHELVRCERH
jgi:hypothetical protein